MIIYNDFITLSGKSLVESYEQTVSADNLSSSNQPQDSAALTESGARENLSAGGTSLVAETVAANVLSQV